MRKIIFTVFLLSIALLSFNRDAYSATRYTHTFTGSSKTYSGITQSLNAAPLFMVTGITSGWHVEWYHSSSSALKQTDTISTTNYSLYTHKFIHYGEQSIKALLYDSNWNYTAYIKWTISVPEPTGSLKVTITPADAVTAGARWRVDSGSWQESGETVSGLSTGTHTVSYKSIDGWNTPSDKSVTIKADQTTTASAYYDEKTGSISVTITPSEAISAGAKWRVTNFGSGAWNDSGKKISGFPEGSYTIGFNSVSGYETPASVTVKVSDGMVTKVTQNYEAVPQTGSLKVTITPAAAVTAGARWRVDSGSWQESGETVSGLSTGTHTVSYKSTDGWNTPSNKSVTIKADQTTTASAYYDEKTGSISVTITPSEAISAGAKWRVTNFGSGAWNDSGKKISGFPEGSYTIGFNSASGYETPASVTVKVSDGMVTKVTQNYEAVPQTGSLKVTITPAAAVTAGARWRVDSGSWQESGETVSGLSTGTHTVSYKSTDGWNTPSNKSVTIKADQTTTASAYYDEKTGSISVTITPSEAISAGAKWRVTNFGSGAWNDSGKKISGFPEGSYTIGFNSASGYETPASVTVKVSDGMVTKVTQNYEAVPQTGSLKVTITPAAAVTAGARWRVDSGSWQESGETVSGLSTGTHTVSYKSTDGWNTPSNKSVTIKADQTTTASAYYDEKTGSISVTITPSEAISAGAKWRVTNFGSGAWNDSGKKISGFPEGSYTIGFNSASGYETPASVTVKVSDGMVTKVTQNYEAVPQTGSLKVTITPAAAVTAGARWRVDSGSWQESGETVSGLSTGTHTVSYKSTDGWNTPSNKSVTIKADQTTTASAYYDEKTGSISVTITPSEAISAGAKWRVTNFGSGAWNDSGKKISGFPEGSYTIGFNSASGYETPASVTVKVSDGMVTKVTQNYEAVPQTGSLKVTITPAAAVTAGARWRVDSGSWQESGETVSGLSTGTHTVSYKSTDGWNTPSNKSVTIKADQTTTASAYYDEKTGSISVTITPSEAISAGAKWRVTNFGSGAWNDSGKKISGFPEGSYTIGFNSASGYETPASVTIKVSDGMVTKVTQKYSLVPKTGSLKVIITPAGAVELGAKWKIKDFEMEWMDSGSTLTDIQVGSYKVIFSYVEDYDTALSVAIDIEELTLTTVSKNYTAKIDYLDSVKAGITDLGFLDGEIKSESGTNANPYFDLYNLGKDASFNILFEIYQTKSSLPTLQKEIITPIIEKYDTYSYSTIWNYELPGTYYLKITVRDEYGHNISGVESAPSVIMSSDYTIISENNGVNAGFKVLKFLNQSAIYNVDDAEPYFVIKNIGEPATFEVRIKIKALSNNIVYDMIFNEIYLDSGQEYFGNLSWTPPDGETYLLEGKILSNGTLLEGDLSYPASLQSGQYIFSDNNMVFVKEIGDFRLYRLFKLPDGSDDIMPWEEQLCEGLKSVLKDTLGNSVTPVITTVDSIISILQIAGVTNKWRFVLFDDTGNYMDRTAYEPNRTLLPMLILRTHMDIYESDGVAGIGSVQLKISSMESYDDEIVWDSGSVGDGETNTFYVLLPKFKNISLLNGSLFSEDNLLASKGGISFITDGDYDIFAETSYITPIIGKSQYPVLVNIGIADYFKRNMITDQDNDGVDDIEEGIGDTDADGMPDYLEGAVSDFDSQIMTSEESSQIISTVITDSYFDIPCLDSDIIIEEGDGAWIYAENGSLSLGPTSMKYNSVNIPKSCLNFQELPDGAFPFGLNEFRIFLDEAGDETDVIIKLPQHVSNLDDSQHAVYRKFNGTTWDVYGDIMSAVDIDGPWVDGIGEGVRFLKIHLVDGGPGDADGIANGCIVDPGGLSVENITTDDDNGDSDDDSDDDSGDGDGAGGGDSGGGGGCFLNSLALCFQGWGLMMMAGFATLLCTAVRSR